ncbi:MAG: hypothetical protein M3N37_05620 [Actinomycetota bacterium]|nr:hypothetical protein [Actinomycetota bacterium]MDP8954386.1 hypothetical protein [Actinomycetota bacterium]
MTYHLKNVTNGQQGICQQADEVPEKLNELVAPREEWVVIQLPPGDHLEPKEVSRGRGPI